MNEGVYLVLLCCFVVAACRDVGLLKFGCEGSSRLVQVLDALVVAGESTARAPRAVAELAHRWPVVAIDTDGLPWTEVDDAEDLRQADQVVASDIEVSLLPTRALGARHPAQHTGAS